MTVKPCCIGILFSITVSALACKEITLHFNQSDFSFLSTGYVRHNQEQVRIRPSRTGFHNNETPGVPDLPWYTLNLLVPYGAKFKGCSFSFTEKIILRNIVIAPVQRAALLTEYGPVPSARAEPDEAIYASAEPYPKEPVQFICSRHLSRYTIFTFSVSPFIYTPLKNELSLIEKITVTLAYEHNLHVPVDRWDDGSFYGIVKEFVDNPNDMGHFIQPPSLSGSVKYLIITSSALKNAFQPFAAWKTQKGVPAEIITIDEIHTRYQAATIQLKIKKCIEDYYRTKGTLWVLLGGDDVPVPDQNTYCIVPGGLEDSTIPADLFYVCFDQQYDWNANGNTLVGEFDDSMDLSPELFIGRSPVRTVSHVNAFIEKSMGYEKKTPSADFAKKMLLSGAELWVRWSGRSDADWRTERMWNECIEPYWDGRRWRLYDTNTDFGGPAYDHNPQNINEQIHTGYNFIFMATHGSQTAWATEGGSYNYTTDNVFALTNKQRQGIIVTMSCITAGFEQQYWGHEPSLCEAFLRNANGGAAAYIGCARYGFGHSRPNTDFGPSFTYCAKFFELLFNAQPARNRYKAGLLHAYHKEALIGASMAGNYSTMRWLQYGINLLGDPELDLFTDNPKTFSVLKPSKIGLNNATPITVATGVADALVCLSKDTEVYMYGYADAAGDFTCTPRPSSSGKITLTVTAHNYTPHISEIEVSAIAGIHPVSGNAAAGLSMTIYQTSAYIRIHVHIPESPAPSTACVMYTPAGKLLHREKLTGKGLQSVVFDKSKFGSGLFFVQIVHNGKRIISPVALR